MHISFLNSCIEIIKLNTKEKLDELFREDAKRCIILGEKNVLSQEFYVLLFNLNENNDNFYIGINADGYGSNPHVLLEPNSQLLFVGFNFELDIIDYKTRSVQSKVTLATLFNKFIQLYDRSLILCFYETGIVALTPQGSILWQFDRAIIVNEKIENNAIKLIFLDEEPVILSLIDGKQLN